MGNALSEENLHTLARAVLDAAGNAQLGVTVTLLEPKLQRLFVNAEAARIFGYSPEEMFELPVLMPYTPAEEARIKAMNERRSRGEPIPTTLETEIIRKDGTHLPIEACFAIVKLDGHAGGVAFIRDISERRRTEAALAQQQAQLVQADRMATVGKLAAGVAHELNNPLAYVLLNLEVLDRELGALLPPHALTQVRTRLATLQQGTERMAAIARDLRGLCRPEAPSLRSVDVERVLESALDMACRELEGRAHVVRRYASVPRVLADATRLGQVFVNLLVNAAQAIPEAAATEHEIRVSIATAGASHVRVEIADTGQGIPSELLEKVFDPFFTTKPAGVGMGLGLSISRNIVLALNGELTIESEPGRGSTFRITLPVATDEHAEAPSVPPPPRATTRPARVLVIDDEPALAGALGAVLALDHDVTLSEGGARALALLESGQSFDAVLCDVVMPDVDGIALYEALGRIRPELRPRVIFMTGAATMPRVAEFLGRVPNPCLDKPIDVERLRRVIRALAIAST
jgi:PAS domain S-box-containing protein